MFQIILSGDTHKATWSDANYPSPLWTLQYSLSGPSSLNVDGVAQSNGSFLITLPSASTSVLKTGTYTWSLRANRNGERYTVDSGIATVRPDLSVATARINIAERMVDLIEKALLNQLSEGEAYESLSISGRSLTSINRKELLQERTTWRTELAAYRRAVSGQPEITTISLAIGSL